MDEIISLRKRIIENDFGGINDMQRRAVFHANGPLLIIAGAGSGKTTTMVNRIAYLIRYGNAYNSDEVAADYDEADLQLMRAYLEDEPVSLGSVQRLLSVNPAMPWQILAITFTNKAANELKERLSSMLGEDVSRDIWASTFHSCCAKILRRFADKLGYDRSFTIHDTDDTKRLIKECQRQLDINDKLLPFRTIIKKISDAKNFLITPQEYERQSEINPEKANPLIAKAYKLYQQELVKANAMDFDDLIFNTVRLLETDTEVREYYQRKFKYVMVDEYQDTNHAQFRLTQLLADGYGNICVVGDDDQSIYKFRGATIENILSFEHQYKNCQVIKLEQNYRSTGNILNAANAVIAHNEGRKGKTLWTANGEGEKITAFQAEDQSGEAVFVAETIESNVSSGKYKYSDHVVLYRANAQSQAIEQEMVRNQIPYRIFGGHKFYDRAEIRDMMAYLTVLNNPHDNVRLSRIINVPARGIGTTTVNHVLDLAQATGSSAFDIISRADEYNILSRSASKLKQFASMISSLQDFVDEEPIAETYRRMVEAVGYVEYLKQDKEKGEDRLENIQELSTALQTYQDENGDDASLQSFLEEIALMTDIDNYNEQADAAVLMTMHSAKGLEFPVVFIVGMEENVFPGVASIYNPEEIEEERRLAYVAITRAREKLFLVNCRRRMLYGNTNHNAPSRFLNEVPDELLERKSNERSFDATYQGLFHTPESRPGKIEPRKGAKNPLQSSKPKPMGSILFAVGDRVKSEKFGEGTVMEYIPMGNDAKLVVAFDTAGTKPMLARYARLTKI